jgi:CAAX prenyl protease-like protein
VDGARVTAETERTGHGWWPYLLPYLSFVALADFGGKLPNAMDPILLFVKPAVPLALLIYFWRRGEYPELRGDRLSSSGALQDVTVGLLLTALWMAPFILIQALIPAPGPGEDGAFDPGMLGAGLEPLALGVRMFGYALVTPFMEELFIRSFVMRYAEVYAKRGDFRDVPLAHYSLTSFLATIVVFTIGHVPWEWWVAVPWVALTNLWFYHRRSLLAVILVHGVTNAAILLIAIFGGQLSSDADGHPLSLWFFV